jgi:Integrase core domain
MSKSGFRWYLIFTDDCSRMTWMYLLKTKDEVKRVFKEFVTMVKTQFGKTVKVIRSDNGTEYVNHDLKIFFKNEGIVHETSCVGTPQQNGIAERKNRHILEITRALLIESSVPNRFWENAMSFAIYLMNRSPTRVNNFKTPLQILSEQITLPSVLNLTPKVFGCTVYVHLQNEYRSKLESRAEKCVFLGFEQNKKGYKCYNPTTQKFYISMDVIFLKNEFFYQTPKIPIQGENIMQQELDFSFLDIPLYTYAQNPHRERDNQNPDLQQQFPVEENLHSLSEEKSIHDVVTPNSENSTELPTAPDTDAHPNATQNTNEGVIQSEEVPR